MAQELLPPLATRDWWETRDRVQLYSRLVGDVRRHLSPPQKHGFHATLLTSAVGLTTTPIPAGHRTLEISFDFTTHLVSVKTSRGDWHDIALEGQSPHLFYEAIQASLEELSLYPKLDADLYSSDDDIEYDEEAVEHFWQALSQIDIWLKEFKASFRGETSPVHLFPRQFDLAMTWLTGRFVSGQDQEKHNEADEKVSFSFTAGDEGIDEPYFYNSVFPWSDEIIKQPLPDGATWTTDVFKGSLIPYETVRQADDPKAKIMSVWQAHLEAAKVSLGL